MSSKNKNMENRGKKEHEQEQNNRESSLNLKDEGLIEDIVCLPVWVYDFMVKSKYTDACLILFEQDSSRMGVDLILFHSLKLPADKKAWVFTGSQLSEDHQQMLTTNKGQYPMPLLKRREDIVANLPENLYTSLLKNKNLKAKVLFEHLDIDGEVKTNTIKSYAYLEPRKGLETPIQRTQGLENYGNCTMVHCYIDVIQDRMTKIDKETSASKRKTKTLNIEDIPKCSLSTPSTVNKSKKRSYSTAIKNTSNSAPKCARNLKKILVFDDLPAARNQASSTKTPTKPQTASGFSESKAGEMVSNASAERNFAAKTPPIMSQGNLCLPAANFFPRDGAFSSSGNLNLDKGANREDGDITPNTRADIKEGEITPGKRAHIEKETCATKKKTETLKIEDIPKCSLSTPSTVDKSRKRSYSIAIKNTSNSAPKCARNLKKNLVFDDLPAARNQASSTKTPTKPQTASGFSESKAGEMVSNASAERNFAAKTLPIMSQGNLCLPAANVFPRDGAFSSSGNLNLDKGANREDGDITPNTRADIKEGEITPGKRAHIEKETCATKKKTETLKIEDIPKCSLSTPSTVDKSRKRSYSIAIKNTSNSAPKCARNLKKNLVFDDLPAARNQASSTKTPTKPQTASGFSESKAGEMVSNASAERNFAAKTLPIMSQGNLCLPAANVFPRDGAFSSSGNLNLDKGANREDGDITPNTRADIKEGEITPGKRAHIEKETCATKKKTETLKIEDIPKCSLSTPSTVDKSRKRSYSIAIKNTSNSAPKCARNLKKNLVFDDLPAARNQASSTKTPTKPQTASGFSESKAGEMVSNASAERNFAAKTLPIMSHGNLCLPAANVFPRDRAFSSSGNLNLDKGANREDGDITPNMRADIEEGEITPDKRADIEEGEITPDKRADIEEGEITPEKQH